jgi:hypothetical protein
MRRARPGWPLSTDIIFLLSATSCALTVDSTREPLRPRPRDARLQPKRPSPRQSPFHKAIVTCSRNPVSLASKTRETGPEEHYEPRALGGKPLGRDRSG